MVSGSELTSKGFASGLPLILIKLSFLLGARGYAGVLGSRGLNTLEEGGRVDESFFVGDAARSSALSLAADGGTNKA